MQSALHRASGILRKIVRFSVPALTMVALCVGATEGAQKKKPKSSDSKKSAAGKKTAPAETPVDGNAITMVPFRERNGKEVFNASGIVPLGDSRFAFVDNKTNTALLELQLTPDGAQGAPITRLPLNGLVAGTVEDIEGLALAESGGHRFIFATPSFSVKAASKKGGGTAAERPSALLRIAIAGDGSLKTEAMKDFRDWFVKNVPAIAASAGLDPESNGLNVEGLGWDAKNSSLLFGIRTPLVDQLPMIVPVRLKDPAGAWTTANLEALAPIRLHIEIVPGLQGIRAIAANAKGDGFLVVVGNATSGSNAPFTVYRWDGLSAGTVTRLPYTFANRIKLEGLTVGSVGGKPAVVLVDDGGGFKVIWL